MISPKLANLRPFLSGRIGLYRSMGIQIRQDLHIGIGVEFDTSYSELNEISNHVKISHRSTIASHVALSLRLADHLAQRIARG